VDFRHHVCSFHASNASSPNTSQIKLQRAPNFQDGAAAISTSASANGSCFIETVLNSRQR
jgi:hypothetical protein